MSIDWNDVDAHITPHFTVGEALLLPRWNSYHNPTYTEKANIQIMAGKMEEVRALVNAPIQVHCWIRPANADLSHPANKDEMLRTRYHMANYNAFVGGAINSQHLVGKAVDFHVVGYEGQAGCREIRLELLPHLEHLGLRMEDKEGGWVHLDNGPVGANGRRFFKP